MLCFLSACHPGLVPGSPSLRVILNAKREGSSDRTYCLCHPGLVPGSPFLSCPTSVFFDGKFYILSKVVLLMKMIKLLSSVCVLLLTSCSFFRSADWSDSSDWPADKGITFVEISLEGRDSATVNIMNSANSFMSKLSLKKGSHLYSLALDEGDCVFRGFDYSYESFFSNTPTLDKRRPLNSEESKDRGGFEYCVPWKTEKGVVTIFGKMSFNVVENDNFYLKCDFSDSTHRAVWEKAKNLYPQTFEALKKK